MGEAISDGSAGGILDDDVALVSFRLEGNLRGVEVGRFAEALTSYGKLVKQAGESENPGADIKVYVRTVSLGSLDTVLGVVASAMTLYSAMPGGAVGIAKAAVDFTRSVLAIRKDLAKNGGAVTATQTGDGVQIVAESGAHVNVTNVQYAYMASPVVEKSTDDMMSALEGCGPVEGLSLSLVDSPDAALSFRPMSLRKSAR